MGPELFSAAAFKFHLSLLFAAKSSQKYKPVVGQVQATLAGALLEDTLDELSTEDETSLDELSTDDTTVLDAAELTELDELELEPLLSEPPQAVSAVAMQRLSTSGDVFIVLPFLLLIALMDLAEK